MLCRSLSGLIGVYMSYATMHRYQTKLKMLNSALRPSDRLVHRSSLMFLIGPTYGVSLYDLSSKFSSCVLAGSTFFEKLLLQVLGLRFPSNLRSPPDKKDSGDNIGPGLLYVSSVTLDGIDSRWK